MDSFVDIASGKVVENKAATLYIKECVIYGLLLVDGVIGCLPYCDPSKRGGYPDACA